MKRSKERREPRLIDSASNDELWALARPEALPPEALRRILRRLREGERPPLVGALPRRGSRLATAGAALVLLLIGSVAGASVYSWVQTRRAPESGFRKPQEETRERPRRTRGAVEATNQETPPAAAVPPTSPASATSPVLAPPAGKRTPVRTQPSFRARAEKKPPPRRLAHAAPVVAAPPTAPTSSPVIARPAAIPAQSGLAPPALLPAPARVPAPAMGSATTTKLPEERLATEARLLGAAIRALRQPGDPARGLSLLDDYEARFPHGVLAGEATLARVDGLRRLQRTDELLSMLDAVALAELPRGRELRVLRGELRLGRNRAREALDDFGMALGPNASQALPPALGERALFGRALARAKLGDRAGAAADVATFLARFPDSPRADELRRRREGWLR